MYVTADMSVWHTKHAYLGGVGSVGRLRFWGDRRITASCGYALSFALQSNNANALFKACDNVLVSTTPADDPEPCVGFRGHDCILYFKSS